MPKLLISFIEEDTDVIIEEATIECDDEQIRQDIVTTLMDKLNQNYSTFESL